MHRILRAMLVLAAGAGGEARAADAAKEAPTIMSPYEVRADSVPFKDWIKVGSPNFIIYTDAGESRAARVLREFEMLHSAGQALFGRRAARYSPTILVLPTAHSDWRKLEVKDGSIEWKAITSVAGQRVTELVTAGYDWEDAGLGPIRAMIAVTDQDRMGINGPFWFERGFSAYYETAEFNGDRVLLGHANPRIFALNSGKWIPWARFFLADSASPEFTKERLISQFDGQSALFTQFLISNSDRSWVRKLEAWLDYLRTGALPSESRFATIFGQDWKQWQKTMANYLAMGSYSVFQLGVPPEVARLKETKFDLPQREIRELFILTQTLQQAVPESPTSLDALLVKGLKSSCLRELLVEACLRWGREDAALQNIRRLIADKSTNAKVYREGDALLTTDAGHFALDCRMGPELAEVRPWDRKGIALEPLDTELENSLAMNEACAPVIDQQSITTIEDCYRVIRGRAPTDHVIMALAMALWRSGDSATANALAMKLKDDPLARKNLREMSGELVGRISGHVAP